MNRLAILGASGHGRVVAEVALSSSWDSVEFYDDSYADKSEFDNLYIHGDFQKLLENADFYDGFHVAIGHNQTRANKLNQLLRFKLHCPNIISPSAIISQSASLGVGISIMPNVVINAKTIVSDAVILNTSCSVDHDCKIYTGVHISPGAHLAGNVSIGNCSWIGIGSTIIQNKIIGDNSIIGAGSVVINDIPSNVTAVGSPSKIIK